MVTIVTDVMEATAVTHSGRFHADEVFATVILGKFFENVSVYRTFEVPEKLPEDVIVYDIGGGKFDHHQKDGNGSRRNGIPYAACGLIWKEFGHKLVENTCNPEWVWSLVDKELIQGIDAMDNGTMPSVEYPSQPMTISSIISGFNLSWDSTGDEDGAFVKAVAFAEIIFDNTLSRAISKASAQILVEEAIEKAEGHVMILNTHLPWQYYVFNSKNKKAREIQFVVYPSKRGGYNWQCVPKGPRQEARKPVPVEWKGLRGAELQKMTGIPTATFCHSAGYVGGASTLEDTVAFAELAVNSL